VFTGCEDKKPADSGGTVISQPRALETPCPEGKLIYKNAYSECISGTWHTVEDDTYNCPPNKTFRVADDDTKQACGGDQPPPESFGPKYRDLQGEAAKCPAADRKKKDDRVLWRCNKATGLWEYAKVEVYECPDGTTGIIGAPTWIPTGAACQWGGKPPVDQVR
jgi:hypothetical protein